MTAEKVKIECSEIKELLISHLPDVENSFNESDSFIELIDGCYDSSQGIPLFAGLLEKVEEAYGIKVRDRMEWMEMSPRKWAVRISFMMMENRLIQSRKIGWRTVQQYLQQNHGIILESEESTVHLFLDRVNATGQFFGRQNLFGVFAMLIDHFYLDFNTEDIDQFNTFKSMDEVYEFLNDKLSARKLNDCKAYYCRNWSLKTRMKTKDILGQGDLFPEGVCMKHLSGKHGVTTRENNRVENAEDSSEAVMGLPYCIKDNRDGRTFEYWSLEDLLDDGWAVD